MRSSAGCGSSPATTSPPPLSGGSSSRWRWPPPPPPGGGAPPAPGAPPLLGVLAGSVALTGGPATALAFAPLFEQAGGTGAAPLGVASATVGIVSGGIIGGPDRPFPLRGG